MNDRSNNEGSALVIVISFTLLSAALSAALLTTSTSHALVADKQLELEQALFVAEAGVERAAQHIESQKAYLSDVTLASDSVGQGSFSYAIKKLAWRTYSITSTGTVNDISRRIFIDRVYLPTYAKYALWMDENGLIFFTGGEEFDGHVHSNDMMWFTDVAGVGPIFREEASSAEDTYGGSIEHAIFDEGLELSASQGQMADVNFNELYSLAVSHGVVLEGQTEFDFTGSSVLVTNEREGWVDHPITIGEDQLIYVKDAQSGDASTQAGQVYVEGTLDGRVSIISENDILIDGHIYYAEDPTIVTSSDDALGLIAKDDVWIAQGAPDDVHIDAAIMATGQLPNNRGSFGVLEYWVGDHRGSLNIFGSIVQDKRGGVGTFVSGLGPVTGFSKNYSFDARFGVAAPPYYPTIADKVEFDGWSEGPST